MRLHEKGEQWLNFRPVFPLSILFPMPDAPEFLFSPLATKPSKPYRQHPTLTVRAYLALSRAEQKRYDDEIDAAAKITFKTVKTADGHCTVGVRPATPDAPTSN